MGGEIPLKTVLTRTAAKLSNQFTPVSKNVVPNFTLDGIQKPVAKSDMLISFWNKKCSWVRGK